MASQKWDAVIDLTSHPLHARRATRDLSTKHWVFVSSSSVYARNDLADRDESSPILGPLETDYMPDMASYGAAKVACEESYQSHDSSCTVIRPGLIGGFGDFTGRTGYYPWRFQHPSGRNVLVPDPTFPVAMIDVDALATWIVACTERRTDGTFNASGAPTKLAEVLRISQEMAGNSAVPLSVNDEVLAKAGINPWMGPKSLPLWINMEGWRYVALLNSSKAEACGLTCRPLKKTLRSALEFEEQRQQPRLAGLSDEEERELRALV